MSKTPAKTINDWDAELSTMTSAVVSAAAPSVNQIGGESPDPWHVLVSTLISLRTRDEVTLSSSQRLLNQAPDIPGLLMLSEDEIAELIYPAGFYKTKARNLRLIAETILVKHNGKVPATLHELRAFPGVGLKTANLVLGVGFGIPAICVDIHVHRIANRRGWISARTPDESEAELRSVLPRKWWIAVNQLLVNYGQQICTPLSPFCSKCPVAGNCPKHGVSKQR